MRERENERDRERERETERKRQREKEREGEREVNIDKSRGEIIIEKMRETKEGREGEITTAKDGESNAPK